MKKLLILVLMLCATFAFAFNETVLGTTHYMNSSNGKFYDLVVTAEVNGNVILNTNIYTYVLTPADKDAVVAVLNDGLRLINIAETNKTTVDYKKDLKSVYVSLSNGYMYTSFITSGYEKSEIEIFFQNGGNNLILLLAKQQIQEFVDLLGKATSTQDDVARQIKLFEQ
jgi:hypothetical protein